MQNVSSRFKVWLLLALFTITGSTLFSQTSKWLWEMDYGGKNTDVIAAMCKDNAGNLYLTGNLTSDSFNFGSIAVNHLYHSTFFLSKVNSTGNVQWLTLGGGFGGSNTYASALPTGVATAASGNTYVTGVFTTDTLVIGSYTLLNPDTLNPTGCIFLIEYDNTGNVLWAETLGNSSHARTNAITLDAADNLYLTGSFTDTVTFGSTVLTASSLYTNVFTVKLNPGGQVVWAASATGNQISITSAAMSGSPDGGIYITGWVQSDSVGFGGHVLLNPLYGALIFITKYDTAGNVLWAHAVGNDSSYQYGYGITADAAANIYVTGSFHSHTITFGNTTFTNYNYGNGNDIFLAKYDAGGNPIWARQEGGNALDEAYSVAIGNDNNLYLTGFFWSRPFVIGHDTFDMISANGSAMFVAKFDTAGNEQWTKFAYSYENVTSLVVIPDDEGNAYVGGYYPGTYMYFDTAEMINHCPTGVGGNILLAKAGTNSSAGIQQPNTPQQITIYPNPSNGSFYIQGLPAHTALSLYDLSGRLLIVRETNNPIETIDMSSYAPGVYLLKTPAGIDKIVKM